MHKLSILILNGLLIMHTIFSMEEPSINSSHVMLMKKLERAIWKHKNNQCKEIIEKNSTIINEHIKFYSGDSGTPLHLAVGYDNIFATQLLLQMNASVNNKTTIYHYTPLHMARNKAIIKLLLKHGANLNNVDYQGASPLCHVLFHYSLVDHDYNFNYSRIKLNIDQRCNLAHCLLKSGASINQIVDNQSNNLLHCAVNNNDSTITSFLLQHGIDIEHKNLNGETALENGIFSYSNRQDALKAFNDKGIIFICNSYRNDIFELLKDNAQQFKKFVHPDSTSSHKINVENMVAKLFMVVQQNKNNKENNNTIIYDKRKGYCFKYTSCEDLEHWIGKETIDYIKKYLHDRCQQALSFAKNGDYNQLKEIVRRYPYILSYNKQITFELLHHMMIKGNKKVFTWLLNRNPDINRTADVNNHYNTLLHEAIMHENSHAIELLIKNNCSLTRENTNSQTPINLLYNINNKECIKAFNNAFADKFFSIYSHQSYYQEIKKVLKMGFDVNICDKNGEMLLLRAAKSHPEKCSLLLKYGAIITQEIVDSNVLQNYEQNYKKTT